MIINSSLLNIVCTEYIADKLICDSSQFQKFEYEDMVEVVRVCLSQYRNISTFEMVGFDGMEMDYRMGQVLTEAGYKSHLWFVLYV